MRINFASRRPPAQRLWPPRHHRAAAIHAPLLQGKLRREHGRESQPQLGMQQPLAQSSKDKPAACPRIGCYTLTRRCYTLTRPRAFSSAISSFSSASSSSAGSRASLPAARSASSFSLATAASAAA